MKSLRNLLAAFALTCALSISTMAGDMDTGKTAATTTGDMGMGAMISADPVTAIALNLLQSVLALF